MTPAPADAATVTLAISEDPHLLNAARPAVDGLPLLTLLTHAHGVADRVPERETADADMGAPRQVLADTDLVGTLRDLK